MIWVGSKIVPLKQAFLFWKFQLKNKEMMIMIFHSLLVPAIWLVAGHQRNVALWEFKTVILESLIGGRKLSENNDIIFFFIFGVYLTLLLGNSAGEWMVSPPTTRPLFFLSFFNFSFRSLSVFKLAKQIFSSFSETRNILNFKMIGLDLVDLLLKMKLLQKCDLKPETAQVE